jgi:hypothetical protein
MARARSTRLTRLAVSTARADSPASFDRMALQAWAIVADVVRDGLVEAGIDPAGVRALHLTADPGCDPIPPRSQRRQGAAGDDGEPFDKFVAPDSDGLAAVFAARIGAIVRTCGEGREPDFANASLAELLAWCLSRQTPAPVRARLDRTHEKR